MDFAHPRRLAAAIALAILAAFAPSTAPAADALTPAQEDAVRSVVRDYLLENPEVLIESLQVYEARAEERNRSRQQAVMRDRADELERDPASPVAGAPDGDVTIVEFMDYRCGYCKKVFPTVQEVIRGDGNVRYVIKEFPILGPESVVASRAALAVWRLTPDRYMDYHSALMTSRGALDEKRILDIAAEIGLDTDAVAEEMGNPEIAAALENNRTLAEALGIRGTPAFVIGGRLIPGAVDAETLRALVAEARQG